MKIGIMQPYFFPYLGYWQLINAVDKYVVFDDVNYIKRGWMNRNYILTKKGTNKIMLQIKDASQNRLINETYLFQPLENARRNMDVLYQSYKYCPWYSEVSELLEKCMTYPNDNLAQYLTFQLKEVCKYLDIKTEILLSSEIKKDNARKAEEKIIDICKSLNGTEYINAIGGKELYHHERFEKENMKLGFLKLNSISYKQFNDEFIPNLSIIDVLMFNGKEKAKELLECYSIEK